MSLVVCVEKVYLDNGSCTVSELKETILPTICRVCFRQNADALVEVTKSQLEEVVACRTHVFEFRLNSKLSPDELIQIDCFDERHHKL